MGHAPIVVLALLMASGALAAPRSHSAKAQFQREHPCPSTGLHRGGCPGYVIDHIEPLCAGGPDLPSNMQWQSVPEAKEKDRWERKLCRRRTR